MDKKTFWQIEAIIFVAVVLVIAILGICFGSVIEGSLGAEVAKWVVVGLGTAALVCGTVWALVATIVSRGKDK